MSNHLTARLDKKIVITFSVVLSVVVVLTSIFFYVRQVRQLDEQLKEHAVRIAQKTYGELYYNSMLFEKNRIQITEESTELLNLIHDHAFINRASLDSTQKMDEYVEKIGQNVVLEKEPSLNYRNPLNKPDEFEERILREFEKSMLSAKDASTGEIDMAVVDELPVWEKTDVAGEPAYRFMYPLLAKEHCLYCHGERDAAPQFISETYSNGFGYSKNDLMGAISLVLPAKAVDDTAFHDLIYTILIGLVAIGSSIALIYYLFQRKLAEPLQKTIRSARSVSQGNLSEKVSYEQHDEIGELVDSFNIMVDAVKEAVRDITDLTMRLNQVSLDISNTATGVLKSAENQTVLVHEITQIMDKMEATATLIIEDMQGLTINVRETRTSIEDLSGTVQEAARNIQEANQVFSQVIHEIQEGRFAIEQVNLSMVGISDKLEGLHLQVQQFDRATRDISSIVESAARTAKQTNLLAVNASIESAIAGEAGKGFKVVANEIRSLAEESTTASQQIKDMVFNIRRDAQKVQDTVIETNQSARDSVATVSDAEKSLDKITQYYSRSSAIMSRLSNLVDTQMRSSQQVTMKTSDMNIRTSQVVEQADTQKALGKKVTSVVRSLSETALRNKESSQEIAQLTQELINQAEQLQSAVRRFKLTETPQLFG
ncbi:methyl-accepting chemotaxis sensory transducer [Chloroherpeton thalassium ATCC 35110]|uniref:Methyl-accepting chemotaxis sensory transducer n=1 Tax=Chloroherpeton thalassium (strain ATCC 35110 / GB-78) TaxID=517418 RepID=B3QXI8_CHLT3|nr:methyl-accepting chemotaxis protein [Chloroherpeton thalassium]ACF14903.1 methyl-accepting chemotaxis sensory transducer [Chloroherpeton thalassium ATCC 35110]